jgi:hypothetical protein
VRSLVRCSATPQGHWSPSSFGALADSRSETAHGGCLSDGDDADEFLQPGEVIAVSCVQIELIGVCGRGDQQVCESAPRRPSFADHSGNDESIAPYGGSVELDRFQHRFDFLQPGLALRGFERVGGKVWPG